jgi:CPA2 family monovalent cation:H+ antiporter-2
MIVEALATQARRGPAAPHESGLAPVREFLPGLGQPVPIQLDEASPGVGKTLSGLDVRGMTGATVLAIMRGQEGLIVPTAREVLQQGDVLAITGTQEAIEAAKVLLGGHSYQDSDTMPQKGETDAQAS